MSDFGINEMLEMPDVLMFYNDALLCYGITAEELKESYTKKFQRNMERW